jgi:sugar lactone lactonase YvrE
MIKNTGGARLIFFGILTALLIALALPLAARQVNYTPYQFTTIAGTAGIGAEDGTNSAARFNYPQRSVVAPSGVIYVADTVNNTIRSLSITGTNCVVTTVAGLGGAPGFVDGVGAVARLNTPEGITMDSAGTIFFTDTGNDVIREMTFNGSTWTVATIAGSFDAYGSQDGTNQSALFDNPAGLCCDAAGNIFVADYANNEIRKMTPSGTNWIVTTIAGQRTSGHADGLNTNATFFYPAGIAIDTNGNLFVGEALNSTVRKITPSGSDWMTSTIAGQAGRSGGSDGLGTNALFEFPADIVVASNGNVFVADAEGYTVRELTPVGTNYSVSTPLGTYRVGGTNDGIGNAALFFEPYGVTFDNKGDLLITDSGNSEIRQATPDGTDWATSTLAGYGGDTGSANGAGSVARFNQPYGIAVGLSNNLFVADNANATIRELTPSGTNWVVQTIAGQAGNPGFAEGLGTNALFYLPSCLAVDTNGAVYVADSGNEVIRRLNPSGNSFQSTTIAGTNEVSGSADGTNSVARFDYPTGVAIDTAGVIYVADSFNSTIRKISPVQTGWAVNTIAGSAGVFSWNDGSGTNALFNYTRGVTVDKNGVVYATDWGNYEIRMLTPTSSNYSVTTIAGSVLVYGHLDGTNSSSSFAYPTDIAVDNNGVLYVTDSDNSTVRKIVHSGTNWIVTTMAGIPGQIGSSDGNGAAALFNYPQGIAVDGNGTVYVTEEFNNTVVKGVALPLIVMTQPVFGAGQLQIPFLVENGSPSLFNLLQSSRPDSAWVTNSAAVLSTIIPGASYKFTISDPPSNQFYLIQTP